MIFFSHRLSKQDFGVYQSFWVYLMMLSTIACGGLGLLIYTYNTATIRQILKQLKRQYFVWYFLFAIVVGLLFYLLLSRDAALPGSITFFITAMLFFLTYSWSIILESILFVDKRNHLLLWISGVYSVLYLAIHYWAVQSAFNLMHLIMGLAVISVIRFAVMLPNALKAISNSDQNDAVAIHPKRIFKGWIALLIFDTSQIVFRFFDKFIVTFLVAKELTAVYMNGTIDIPFIPLLFAAVSNAAILQLNNAKERNNKRTLDIIQQSSKNIATLVIPIFCFLMVFRNELIQFVFSEKYMAAVPIFAISIFKILTYLFTVPFLLQFRQRGDLLNKGAILDIVCTSVLIFPLYRFMGLNGIILSFVISSFIQIFYYTWCAAHILRISVGSILPYKNWLLKFVLFLGFCFLSQIMLIKYLAPLPALIVSGLLIAAGSLVWLFIEYKNTGIVTFASENNRIQES
jgi:O-antigen/teichoic acid export membrane protein